MTISKITMSRRGLFRRAAQRFAPLVGGLFVVTRLDETLAREGSLGGRLGGRRGKDRRGRDKKRHRQNNNSNNPGNDNGGDGPLGSGAPDVSVSLIIENLTAAPIDSQGWAKAVPSTAARRCVQKDLQTIPPNTAPTFAPDSYGAIAMLFGGIFIEGLDQPSDDGFPFVRIYHNVTMSVRDCEYGGVPQQPVFVDDDKHQLGVGQSFDITVQGHNFTIRREGDANSNRIFRIQVKS
jgi:hypothetical protein